MPWRPPIPDVDVPADAPEELRAALDEQALLAGSPVPVDLSEGGVVGIVGDRRRRWPWPARCCARRRYSTARPTSP